MHRKIKDTNFPCAEDFIRQCYQHYLFRDPDEDAIKAWVDIVRSGSVPACRIPEKFRNSAEFNMRRSALRARRIGHLHIAKTAGTAVRQWLSVLFDEREIYEDGRVWNPSPSQARFVCGHVHFSFLKNCGCTHLFTVLRDPIERLVSLYRFGRSAISGWPADDPVKTLGFEDWLRCTDSRARVHQDGFYATIVLTDEEQKGHSKEALIRQALQRYKEFTVVGIQEELTDFFARASATLGIPKPPSGLATNTAELNTMIDSNYIKRPHISNACQSLLADITDLDYAIYNGVRNMLRPAQRELPS